MEDQPATQVKKNGLRFEAGKFCLDIAKLVFGGVILAGLMKQDLDYYLLFILGLLVVGIFCIYGFILLASSNINK